MTSQHTVRFHQDLFSAIKVLADRERRTITMQLDYMLREHTELAAILRARGDAPASRVSAASAMTALSHVKRENNSE